MFEEILDHFIVFAQNSIMNRYHALIVLLLLRKVLVRKSLFVLVQEMLQNFQAIIHCGNMRDHLTRFVLLIQSEGFAAHQHFNHGQTKFKTIGVISTEWFKTAA